MSETAVQWVKLSTGLFQNPKITQLRSLPGGDRLVLLWIMLLTLAGRCNRSGRLLLTEDIPYDLKMLATQFSYSQKTLAVALEHFVRLNMIKQVDGVYAIANWEKYQNVEGMERIRESRRRAQARWREKKKTSTVDSTGYPVDDAEEEEEAEKEEEKEIHSVSHARREFLRGTLGGGVGLLSNEQMDDLLERLSLEEFDKYVAIVRDQELQGKHYRKKTHYQAILDMAEKDRRVV